MVMKSLRCFLGRQVFRKGLLPLLADIHGISRRRIKGLARLIRLEPLGLGGDVVSLIIMNEPQSRVLGQVWSGRVWRGPITERRIRQPYSLNSRCSPNWG